MARDGMSRDGLSLAHTARIAVTGVGLLFLSGGLGLAQSQQEPAKQDNAKSAKAPGKSLKKKSEKAESSDAAEKAEAGKKANPAEVQKALDAAQKSLDAGKIDVAGGQASSLISKGGLDSRSMARALAIRGHAHKKQGKPAQAIADLQSALWLKGGLNDAERASAAQARVEAYREAGLSEPPAIGGNKGKTADTKAAAQETSRPIATAAVTPRVADTAQPAASGGGNFFSNLFGQKPATPPAQPVATPAAPVNAAVSSWSEATTAKAPAPKAAAAQPKPKAMQVASAAPAAAAGTTAAKQAGTITLQLAAVGSKAEAEAIAQRVKNDYGAQIGQRRYAINEAAFGGGTFYRVHIGPFSDQAESQTLCSTLRGKGIDCMLVSN